MRVLNFGSLNIDYVYQVEHMVRPGETLGSSAMQVHPGGKGANQSAALGKAGVAVYHAGRIGSDGQFLTETLAAAGVNIDFIETGAAHSGHAIIQVDSQGENAILLFGGGNHEISDAFIEKTLAQFSAGDILLLQNEINNIPLIMKQAKQRGMTIWFNPAPYASDINDYPLDLVDCFIVNETEAAGMAQMDADTDPETLTAQLLAQFPNAELVMTLGGDGVLFKSASELIRVPARPVQVVDTTAAGDTFIGYYAASLIDGMERRAALERACCAAGIAVSQAGAMTSVPSPEAVAAVLA